jgi:hypothetical protein
VPPVTATVITKNEAESIADALKSLSWTDEIVVAHDWIFSLDADERVPEDLREEIRGVLASPPKAQGFRMPRVSFYLGRWVRTTDMYPDYQLRLYNKRHGYWEGMHVHESVRVVTGGVGHLKQELQHYPYKDVSEHLIRMDRYTTLAARQMFEKGKRATRLELLFHPAAAFVRNYLLKGGFRDGKPGLIISLINSYYVMLKFAKLWELQRD